RQQPPEPGHGQHAMREHVGQSSRARVVDVHVNGVVVARSATVKRQRQARQRRQLDGRKLGAHLNVIKAHRHAPCSCSRGNCRSTVTLRKSATSSPCCSPPDLLTRVSVTTNSSAPPFLS